MRALEAIADRLAAPPPPAGAPVAPPPAPQAALPPPAAPAPGGPSPTPPPAGQAAPLPLDPTPPLAVPNPVAPRPPAAPPQAAPAPPQAPVMPPAAATRPAQRLAPDAPVPLPFGRSAAAAALQRGGALLLAFDDSRAPDLAALRRLSPALARLQALEVPGSTVLRLLLAPGAPVPALRRDADGIWMLHPAGAGGGDSIGLDQEEGEAPRLLLRARGPGRVIAVPDPEAPGGLLLLGLLPAPARGLPIGAAFAPFDLLPTDQGVAVAARDSAVQLRAVPEGFAIPLAASGPLAIGPVQQRVAIAADEVPRLLALPQDAPAALLERRRRIFAELIAAPPLARGPLRLQLSETLLALGLGAEAQALTQLALEEDPRMAGEPRALLLLAAGALLAGRAEEALAPLEDARLPPEGEAALWRALARLQLSGEAPADAALATALARTAPLLLRYPPTLRDRLLPPVARSLAEAGSLRDAAALLQAAGPVESAPYAFARARLAEARGDLDTALPAYEKLAEGRDRDIRDRARGRIAEAGLASGRLEPGAAAAMLEAAIPAWRGDARELARRLRAAELYEQARQHESALALLEETEQLFPDAAEQVRARTGRALLGVLNDPATPVLEAAQTFVRRQDQLPPGAELDAAALRIAEGLAALDLHAPAAELLGRAAERSERAAPLRLRLAELQVAGGEGEAALATLRALPVAALPPELRPRHALAQARALALAGNLTEATQALRGVGPAGAARLADLLAAQQDWPGAADALAAHAAATLPAAPAPLDAGQRQMLLRLAAFRALAGDEARMAELRTAYGARMRGGPLAEAFATLTTPPPGPDAPELQRLRQELAMGRALSDALR
ncbi:hypothetical protein [Pseudoroseomonas cervicalis]|uniref:hypothetical protein n=1 Tax=Teichococcus cervicalis TaxID=204525 RepID=UPI0022F17BFD|nr:hypothetical protein [Pseudoroseomonas cervicalis]WBV44581.1 hypothetical protein PFY06_08500 [Pseudoroseomonas cervicalis]